MLNEVVKEVAVSVSPKSGIEKFLCITDVCNAPLTCSHMTDYCEKSVCEKLSKKDVFEDTYICHLIVYMLVA